MYLTHLSLKHFRNYNHLNLAFDERLTLLQGYNAQGKTNLLEAIHFLATSKSVHAQSEREVVNWQASEEPIPYSRVAGTVHGHEDFGERAAELEIILTPRGEGNHFQKQVKVNGVNRRSMDLVGILRSVLFLPEDIKLVSGGPGERRRYLDVALCQIDRNYCRTLSAYQKVLSQRNSLLKNLREQGAHPDAEGTRAQLGFWDEQLISRGAAVMARRQTFVRRLEDLANVRHHELTGGRETLQMDYVPSFDIESDSSLDQQSGDDFGADGAQSMSQPIVEKHVRNAYHKKLDGRRRREIAAGISLYGPHRDDLRFLSNGHDLRRYGSRGQQRTAALSLKLAEVQAMAEITGTAPVLLLDDVMSELDARRRATLLTALDGVEQAIITTTDWEDFAPDFRNHACLLRVHRGKISICDSVSATHANSTES